MSLTFFIEAGIHGPIEPELVRMELSKLKTAYSDIFTSGGFLRASCCYSHATSHSGAGTPCLSDAEGLTTPIQFLGSSPAFSPALLRRLRLLEWLGLHRMLQTLLDDLANVGEDDRALLLMGVLGAEIDLRMPGVLLAKAVRSNCVMVWLSVWLLTFRCLTYKEDAGLPCKLNLRGDDGQVITMSVTGLRGVDVSTWLRTELVAIPAMDGEPAASVTVGDIELGGRSSTDSSGRAPSLTFSASAASMSTRSTLRTPSLMSGWMIGGKPGDL